MDPKPQVKLPFSGPPFSVASTGHTPESFMSAVDISGNGDLSATEIEIALKDYGLGRENPATKVGETLRRILKRVWFLHIWR